MLYPAAADDPVYPVSYFFVLDFSCLFFYYPGGSSNLNGWFSICLVVFVSFSRYSFVQPAIQQASQSKNLSEFQHVWTNFLLQRGVDHHQMDPESLLEYEFGLLEEFSLRQIIRSRPFDPLMDRYDDGCPYHENKITLLDGTEMSASTVRLHEDVFNYDKFIATQAPFQHNVHSFWKMIEENDIDQVVMLTELFEDPSFELCYAYWPKNKDEKLILKNGTEITLSDEV